MPCSAAKRIAAVIRSSIFSRVTPIASSFRSEIGDSITDARTEVGRHRPREAPDLRPQAGLGDQPDRVPVVLRDAREPGLDPVDAEVVEEPRDLELLLRVEHDADRLLPVAQRRVVEPDAAAMAVRVVQLSRPDHPRTTPSGNDESLSTPS